MEPPSPISIERQIPADQMSDDPLSNSIFMVMGDSSDENRERFFVCAWSARTGLSYIGSPASMIS